MPLKWLRSTFRSILCITLLLAFILVLVFHPKPILAQSEWHEVALLGHGSVNQIALNPNGDILAAGRSAGVWLYEYPGLKPITHIEGNIGEVTRVAFSSDGGILAIGGGNYNQDQGVYLWDVNTDTELYRLAISEPSTYISVSLSPNGETLAYAGSSENILHLWDITTQSEIAALEQDGLVRNVKFSPDGRFLASVEIIRDSNGSINGNGSMHFVRLWEATTGEPLAVLEGHTDIINVLTFSRMGESSPLPMMKGC